MSFWKRISPFAVPTVFRLCVVLAAAVVLTFLLLSSDPSRIFRWMPIRGGRDVYEHTPDWVQHFSAYLLFSFLLQWYAAGKSRWFVPLLAGFAVIHAMTTEYLQRFVPERTSDLRDLVVNFLGIASGMLAARAAMWLFDAQFADVAVPLQFRPVGQVSNLPVRSGQVGNLPRGACGLSRNAVTVAPGELKPARVINFGFLAGLSVVSIVLVGTVHVVHGWQVQRHAGGLMELGRQAQGEGDLRAARDYFARYVGLVPGDVGALADYGLLLDEMHVGPRQARQVFMVYEDVLRADPTREEIRRRQIEIAMEAGRIPDALAHVRVLRQSYPTEGKLDYQAGRCFEELAEHDSAVKAYEAALEHSPDLLDTYARLAWMNQTKLERPERARKLLDDLVARFRASATAWLTRGRFQAEFGSRDAALADLEQARKLAPDAVDVLLASARLAYDRATAARTEGRAALAQRIVAESRQQLQRGVEQHPNQLDLRLQRVMLEVHFGVPTEAQRQIDELLKLSPKNVQAHLLLADMTIEQGRFEQAQAAIDRLPHTPGSDALRRFLEGRRLMSQRQWPQAIEALEHARRITTDSSSLMERTELALAQCHAAAGDDEAQAAAFRRVLKANPVSVPARLGLAAVLLKQQRMNEAIAEFRPLAHLRQVRLQLARLLIARNLQLPELAREWSEIETLLAQAKEQHDDSANERLLRSEMLTARGQPDAARRVIAEGAALVNEQRARAGVLATSPRRADQQAALKLLSDLADQNQLLPKDRWLLGRLLESQGQTHEADGHFRAVLAETSADAEYRIEYIGRLIRRGQLDEAQQRFDDLRRQQPQAFSTLSLELRLHAARGEMASVVNRLKTEADLAGDDAARLSQLAILADGIGAPLAERLYRQAAERQPQYVSDLVRFLVRAQQVPAAFEVCESAWSRLPSELVAPLALSLLAFPEGRTERLPPLETKLVKAVEQNTQSLSLLANLADLRCWQERYADAEELYRRVLSREPTHAAAANHLAWLLALRQHDLDDAAQLMEKLIEQHGPTPQLLDTRGCVYLALHRVQPAVNDFAAASDEAPSPVTLLHLAIAQAESNDLAAAQATLAEARRLGLKSDALHPLERPWLSKLEHALSRSSAGTR